MGQAVRHSPKERHLEKLLTPRSVSAGWHREVDPGREACLFPETVPYLLVRYAQARRGPYSRLVIAGILTVVLHLRLGQAAAQGTHPISPAEVGETELGLNTLPRAPSPVSVPQNRCWGWGSVMGNQVPSPVL